MRYDIYTGLLKAFPMRTEGESINFSYDNRHSKFMQLKNQYPIDVIAGAGDDFSKAVNLLHWVSNHIYHKGDYSANIASDSWNLLNYSFDKGSSCGIHCAGLATVLTECLLAVGLKARKVFLMPCSPYDGDNHAVTHVYLSEMNKWVMLDPTYNAYLLNEEGNALSLLELRDRLANHQIIFFNKEANYNGQTLTEEDTKEAIIYFAKNMFYLYTPEISAYGEEAAFENRDILLCPEGYDVRQVRISNIEYRMNTFGDKNADNAWMLDWLEFVKNATYTYCSSSAFEASPNLIL